MGRSSLLTLILLTANFGWKACHRDKTGRELQGRGWAPPNPAPQGCPRQCLTGGQRRGPRGVLRAGSRRTAWAGEQEASGVGDEWWPKPGDIKGRSGRDHGGRRLGAGWWAHRQDGGGLQRHGGSATARVREAGQGEGRPAGCWRAPRAESRRGACLGLGACRLEGAFPTACPARVGPAWVGGPRSAPQREHASAYSFPNPPQDRWPLPGGVGAP